MIPPTLPNKYVLLGAGLILAFGFTFSYGYYKGGEQAEERFNERLLEANEKLLESEKALARASVRLAEEDARRLSERASRGSQTMEEYKRVEPSEVSPVDCISSDQRMFIRQLGASTDSPR
jgi:hypothetical protein